MDGWMQVTSLAQSNPCPKSWVVGNEGVVPCSSDSLSCNAERWQLVMEGNWEFMMVLESSIDAEGDHEMASSVFCASNGAVLWHHGSQR